MKWLKNIWYELTRNLTKEEIESENKFWKEYLEEITKPDSEMWNEDIHKRVGYL